MPDYDFLVRTEGIKFEEDENSSWINGLRVATFNHPNYGKIEITPERLQKFAASVNEKVRGIDPDIDYDHKATDGKAAGWVKEADVRDDQLWLKVDWTDAAAQAIKNREYRYFSPEYMDEWTDQSEQKHEDVLVGGALTNRPFMKDLVPLNFDEHYQLRDIPTAERKQASGTSFAGKNRSFPILKPADVSAAARSLGRAGSDNYSTATIKANIIRIAKRKGGAFIEALPDSWKTDEGGAELDPKLLAEALGVTFNEGDSADDLLAKVGELKAFHETKASEEDKARKFVEDYPEEAARMAEYDKRVKLSETKERLTEWEQKGLSPAAQETIREQRLATEDTARFDEAISAVLNEGGIVQLGERGTGEGNVEDKDVETKVSEKIASLMKDNDGMSYSEAARKVATEDKGLAKELADAQSVTTK